MHQTLQATQESSDKRWEIFPNIFKQLENKMFSQEVDYFGVLAHLALWSSEAEPVILCYWNPNSVFLVKEVTEIWSLFCLFDSFLGKLVDLQNKQSQLWSALFIFLEC